MANRFVGKIKSGEIESVDELKSEFKALAKLSHPDLRGPGAGGDEFARLRDEYEAALRDFVKHRFGSRPAAGGPSAGGRDGPMADDAWACLALLLKRGFPKVPRHEKEILRYEYARWRLSEALGPARRARFAACESELLDMRSGASSVLAPALRLLGSLIDYREKGLGAMRTHIVLSLGALRSDPRVGPGYAAFALSLAAEIGIGGEIAPESARG
jgi:hypothetical protein